MLISTRAFLGTSKTERSLHTRDLQGLGLLRISLALGVVWSLDLSCYPFYNYK